MFVSNRAVFLKKKFLDEGTNASKIELDEVRSVEESTQSSKPIESDLIRSNLKPIVETSLRRSDRVPHQPDRYYDFLFRDGDPIKLDENNKDPITYIDAMQRSDSDKWLEAIKFEMESMKINNVWILVDPPEGIKPVGHKWIFKKKRGADEKVKIYKVRLVAKDYYQHYGIDYDEIFSFVAMLKSIRIIFVIAAYLDYKIWQMNVKIVLLNGELEEEVYMIQPEGFISTNESKVCKL